MHTRRRRVLSATVGGLAVAAVWVLMTLPDRARVVDLSGSTAGSEMTVGGAFHVHTIRSDGGASVDDIAGAAAGAGLQFLIVTDHGDGTRVPDAPQFRAGVLTLDSVEISTDGGHYIAVGLPATPYPLGGKPDTVVEDVRRLGGFGVVAHPTSSKIDLRWSDPDLSVDGIEWLNADSEWRDESRVRLAMSALRYPLRPTETLASLLDRPDEALAMWDRASRRRHTVGLAGHDAHGRVATGNSEEGSVSLGLAFPDYGELFRTFSVRVQLHRPFSGNARDDAETLLQAIRAGRLFTVIDAVASPATFRFEAVGPTQSYSMGETVHADVPVELRASAAIPSGGEIVLLADGQPVHTASGQELRYRTDEPGVYRVEVRVGGAAPGARSVPWIVGNAITVGEPPIVPPPPPRTPVAWRALMGRTVYEGGVWSVEHDSDSEGEIATSPRGLIFRYRLSESDDGGAYATAMRPVEGAALASFDGITFDVVADRPVRLFVQLRASTLAAQPRWRSSFYADTEMRRVTITFDELDPTEPERYDRPDLVHTDALLLGVEPVNAMPGSAAEVIVRRLRLERW